MSQCIARTKDFERCKNDAEKGSVFCRRHRWWWLITLFAAIVALTTIGANIATMFGITFPNPLGQPTVAARLAFDEFNADQGFQSTGDQVRISQGKIFWNVSRNGGDQYLYRTIPTFRGNMRLTVVGQINEWTNNCRSGVGIGDKPGSGIAIHFGYYGGGCSITKAMIMASGASFNIQEDPQCTFVGDWLWIYPKTPMRVELTTNASSAELVVEGVGNAKGIVNYPGDFNTLWIGMSGDGDWPSCSGEIDSIKIEPLQ